MADPKRRFFVASGVNLSKHRIEALSDGVFAIAMTLLVLELKVPDLPAGASNSDVVARLSGIMHPFFAFGLTFILSALFWFLHSLSFHFIRAMNMALTFVNLFFLMFVCTLPFSAALLGRAFQSQAAEMIYYGNQFVLSALLLLHWKLAEGQNLLADSDPEARARLSNRLLALPIGCAASVVIAAFRPDYAPFGFILFVLILRFGRFGARRHHSITEPR